jgi:exodeoxyribonuclease (lambda-induced)
MMTAEQKAAWLSARAGKLTASRMADAMSYLKNGSPTAARTKLMHELLAERLTGSSVPHVVTDAMQHGLDFEDEAVDVFVERYGRNVHLSRFYDHPTIENFGATPDRELDDGLLEIKCPTTVRFLEWSLAGIVPMEHRPQMTAQLACTGRKWCGFIAYDPRIKDESKRLFMRKFEPTAEDLAAVEAAAIAFLTELDIMFDQFVTAA